MKKPKKPTVKSVLAECKKAVKKGLGKKRAGNDAEKFWTKGGRKSIARQLKNGVDWHQAKKRVLPTATKMGRVAAVLTGRLNIVPLWAAEAASAAVKRDPKCPPSVGQGGFCP